MVNHCVIVRRPPPPECFLFSCCFVRLRPCCPQGFYSETHSSADAQEGQEDEVQETEEEERSVFQHYRYIVNSHLDKTCVSVL